MTGKVSYYAGLAAEDCVAREYARRGVTILESRWRGAGGEIDLIAQDGSEIVFIEVKKSRSIAQAAQRIGPRQVARIFNAASAYVETQPKGQLTPMRFDAALVDGVGRVDILEGALAA